MKLKKLARDVRSNELAESEKDRLAELWKTPCYRLPLIDGLCLRDAALDRKPVAIAAITTAGEPEHERWKRE